MGMLTFKVIKTYVPCITLYYFLNVVQVKQLYRVRVWQLMAFRLGILGLGLDGQWFVEAN